MTSQIRVFMTKLRAMFWRRRSHGGLEDEIQLHTQMLKERFILQGMVPSDAEAAARRQFGNPTLLRERHYEQRTFFLFVTLIRDLRFGLHQLQRSPILTSVAILALVPILRSLLQRSTFCLTRCP